LITGFVYALFDLVARRATNVLNGTFPGKSWKKGFLSPGKHLNLVFPSPGKSWKKHLNVCTNPVIPIRTNRMCQL